MSVTINPRDVLGFPRPLTQHVKRTLSITNPNDEPVAFKVKTTAPKLYCVRPNSGRVEPGETLEVQVMLQAMKEEPPLNIKCKDKFLIQSTKITPEKEHLSLTDLWSGEAPEDIHSQKIRVAYLPPEGQTVPEEDEHNQSSVLNTSDTRFHTVHQTPPLPEDANGHAAADSSFTQAADTSTIHPIPPPVHREPTPQAPLVNVNVHTPPTPPPAPVPAPIPAASQATQQAQQEQERRIAQLAADLKHANEEIERLRNLISSMPDPSTLAPTSTVSYDDSGSTITPSEFGIRRRSRGGPTTVFSDDDGTSTIGGAETEIGSYVDEGILTGHQEGVPLQIVILIALGVFVTTYLFF
ncbi:VAMP-associated protein [Panus rudis PR-1116 ss-1]|nr:VAMP-associated protein [Panus rudis PR-1116 ss-1]